MSYREFLQEARKGMPAPVYSLASADPYLHAEAVSALRGIVPAHEQDFNFLVFDVLGDEAVPVQQVLDAANAVPFFSGRKFVVLENTQKLLKKDVEKMVPYLRSPAESSVLVLLCSGAPKKDLKDALAGVRQISLDISERDIPAWMRDRARAKGIALSERAAEYLLGIIGPDPGLLSSEIDKCGLLGKTSVDLDDVVDVVEGKRTFNAFALIDAIRSRDADRVFGIFRVLRETEEPYGILGAINWQYAKSLAERDSPRDRAYLHKVFAALQDADLQIKTSGGAYPLELLLVRLMQFSRRR